MPTGSLSNTRVRELGFGSVVGVGPGVGSGIGTSNSCHFPLISP